MLARVEKVAPGFTSSVLHRQVIGPHQMQEEYGLVGGNIFHGELSLGQMFHARPAAGYADLRTPVRGLYQAGSATHGGGGVTGIPGRNVVRQILADRRAERWRRRVRPTRPGQEGIGSELTPSIALVNDHDGALLSLQRHRCSIVAKQSGAYGGMGGVCEVAGASVAREALALGALGGPRRERGELGGGLGGGGLGGGGLGGGRLGGAG